MSRDSATNLGQFVGITVDNQKKVYKNEIDGSGLGHIYRFRTLQRSSIDLALKPTEKGDLNVELIRDRDKDRIIDPGEIVASSRARGGRTDRIKFSGLEEAEYFIRVFPAGNESPEYELSVSGGSSNRVSPEYKILSWTNRYRRQNDLPRLALNTQLSKSASKHAKDMATGGFVDHEGSNGSTPGDRIGKAGYQYSKAAENIATGKANHRAAFDAWKNSASDRTNLLDENLEELGVSYFRKKGTTASTGRYWVQNFATPSDGSIYPDSQGVWTGSFLNRTSGNLSDYSTYDFDDADAVVNLGNQGNSGSVIAKLKLDYGLDSPADGIQKDRFAMEAWTQIELEAGKFYRLTSDSDDGTRFLIKNSDTGKVLTELAGDWRDRGVSGPTWEQLLRAPSTGDYDLYVQYYENIGESIVDIKLEAVTLPGEVVTAGGVNLRTVASTVGNTPIDVLDSGESFTVLRKVKSTNDTAYPDWYEVTTSDGKKGFVVASDSLVDISGDTGLITIGESTTQPPIGGDDDDDNPPIPSGTAYIGSRVLKTSDDKIAFRSSASLDGSEIGRLGMNTPVTILGKVTGDYYLDTLFDEWYHVRVNVNGQQKEGYVAAYYVDVASNGKSFATAISKNNPYYLPHLEEAEDPYYYSTSYKPFIEEAASIYDWLSPSIIAGIGSRETAWGLFLSPKGPTGTGDGGHGRGLMQVDDRYHQEFIATGKWADPRENILYAIDNVLNEYYEYLDDVTSLQGTELLRGAIAAYNAGPGNVVAALDQGLDVDYYTTGQDYSWDVLNRAGWFQLNGWT